MTPERFGKPYFLVTIDTEGDNVWDGPREITTRNAGFLPRFQRVCERYGIRPTYLTNYEMVESAEFNEFAQDLLKRQAGEIGMHLHAWNNPPLTSLTSDDFSCLPFLVEYPEALMREKIRIITDTLENVFGVKMVSHRAGRWNLDARYVRMLIEEGYLVDCSVTPLVSWREFKGDPAGIGGADYTQFPSDVYWIDQADISRPGCSPLLEVPMTIVKREVSRRERITRAVKTRLKGVVAGSSVSVLNAATPVSWLRPNGRNRRALLNTIDRVLSEGRFYAEFMLHSSEFMPGGSPTFSTERTIERLYEDLEVLFAKVAASFVPATLAEFHHAYRRVSGATRPTK